MHAEGSLQGQKDRQVKLTKIWKRETGFLINPREVYLDVYCIRSIVKGGGEAFLYPEEKSGALTGREWTVGRGAWSWKEHNVGEKVNLFAVPYYNLEIREG